MKELIINEENREELSKDYPNLIKPLLEMYEDRVITDYLLAIEPEDEINFECRMCGDCCKTTPNLFPEDINELKKTVNNLEECVEATIIRYKNPYVQGPWLQLKHKDDGYCIFYKEDEGCGVHERKPLNCKMLPIKARNMKVGEDAFNYSVLIALNDNCKGLFKGNELKIEDVIKENVHRLVDVVRFSESLENALKKLENEGRLKIKKGIIRLNEKEVKGIIEETYFSREKRY